MIRDYPLNGLMTTGSRCELTQRVKTPRGIICEARTLGMVVKGQCLRSSCWDIDRVTPYVVILDGVDGIFECNHIRPSTKEDQDAIS